MADSEMGGFVFAVIFIVVFSALVSTTPAGLSGAGESGDQLQVLDPRILTDFTDGQNWTKSDMAEVSGLFAFGYVLGSFEWVARANNISDIYFDIYAKLYYIPIWLGHYDPVIFTAEDGTNRGDEVTITEIVADATDGYVLYTMTFDVSGNSAGGLIIYWNTTTYSDPYDAWTNDALYFLHGVGLEETVSLDIGSLLLGLILLQLPNVPILINIFLALPVWACIAYIAWFIAISMIPFLGGG